MRGLDLATTRFVVISKSGNTPETLIQIIAAIEAVRAAGLGKRIPELFLGLTEPRSKAHQRPARSLRGLWRSRCFRTTLGSAAASLA